MIQECLIRLKIAKKKIFFLNYKCQMHKLSEFFFKKISWSQMIQNCLIRLEMAKKNRRQTVVFGNSGGTAADLSVFHGGTFNSKDLQKKWIIIIKNAFNMA